MQTDVTPSIHPEIAIDRDPVCGMTVGPDSPHRYEHGGREYRFCCASCRTKFAADPERYLRAPASEPHGQTAIVPLGSIASPQGATSEATEWTCPMHPEIVRDRPGSCPICGMALEPKTITAEEPANPELADMRRRFLVCAALTAPLLLSMFAAAMPGAPLHRLLSPSAMGWLELALATPVVLWGVWPFFVRGVESIANRSPNMFTLIALGVAVAYLDTVAAVLVPGVFPASFRDASGRVATYFEAAAVIVTLVLLGQWLELRARSRTSAAI